MAKHHWPSLVAIYVQWEKVSQNTNADPPARNGLGQRQGTDTG